MVDLDEIEIEIKQLEARGETTYSLCERLAWLYIVRDHLEEKPQQRRTDRMGGSEFLEACSDIPCERLLSVIDQHMQVLKVVQPKEYDAVMGRIRALKNL